MSEQAQSHHHILPLSVYLSIGATLLILTGITIWVAMFDLGPVNLLAAMLIACTKASLVALFFMHLKYDNKLYAVVFVGALLFLSIFIIFTMFDTMTRDAINKIEAGQINDKAVIYQQTDTTAAATTDSTAVTDSASSEPATTVTTE